jgi:hypothetical protein
MGRIRCGRANAASTFFVCQLGPLYDQLIGGTSNQAEGPSAPEGVSILLGLGSQEHDHLARATVIDSLDVPGVLQAQRLIDHDGFHVRPFVVSLTHRAALHPTERVQVMHDLIRTLRQAGIRPDISERVLGPFRPCK